MRKGIYWPMQLQSHLRFHTALENVTKDCFLPLTTLCLLCGLFHVKTISNHGHKMVASRSRGYLLPLPHPSEREKVSPSGVLRKARKLLFHKPLTNVFSSLLCPDEVIHSCLREIVPPEVTVFNPIWPTSEAARLSAQHTEDAEEAGSKEISARTEW